MCVQLIKTRFLNYVDFKIKGDKMFDVVSFGSALVDVFVNTEVAERKGFMYYPLGEKIQVKELKFDIGGGGTNTAVAFSRLGFKTGYIGKIGDDENGRKIFDSLKRERIKFLGKKEKGRLTGCSIVLDSKGGERTILTYKGINDDVSMKDIKKFKTRWLYFSSSKGKSLQTKKELVKTLKKRGTRIAFNPSAYLIKEENLSLILKLTDILILNKEEARMLVGHDEKDLLKGLYKLGPKINVITDKNKMISCYDGNRKYFLKPNKIEVIERTGAGDAFSSGFVAGQIAGKSIEDSLKIGLRESESVIQHFGAKNNLLRMGLK